MTKHLPTKNRLLLSQDITDEINIVFFTELHSLKYFNVFFFHS